MFTRILICTLLLSALTAFGQSAVNPISAGDSLEKVRAELGTPRLEYPLKGKLIQEFKSCTVISSKGVVLSVTYKKDAEKVEAPAKSKPAALTFQETRTQAAKGDAKAQYILAFCYQSGQSVDRDPAQAVRWYTKSALQGHMPAQHNLGVMYMNGEGVEKDLEEACMWAVLAAANGNKSLLRALELKMSDEELLAGKKKAQLLSDQLKKQAAAKTAEAAKQPDSNRKPSDREVGARADNNENSSIDKGIISPELTHHSST